MTKEGTSEVEEKMKEETNDNSLSPPEGPPQNNEEQPPVQAEDQYKSKRGRKPSQAKLAMLESKKAFAEKRKLCDGEGGEKKSKKKAKEESAKTPKKNSEATPPVVKSKRKKIAKKPPSEEEKPGRGKRKKVEDDEPVRRRTRKARLDEESEEEGSSEDGWWDDGGRWDAIFNDDDDDEELSLHNTDEDTEDASETDMATLEEEISEMKEQINQDKIKELRGLLQDLENRTLPEYLERLTVLQRQRDEWIRTAQAFKVFEERELEREYEYEKKQNKLDFETKKNELKEVLVNELKERRKMIEAEKSNGDLTSHGVGYILPMEVKPATTRKLRRRPNDPPPATEKKRKNASAQISYLLEEDHIIADLKKINKNFKVEEKPVTIVAEPSKIERCDPSQFPDGSDSKIKDDQLFFNKEWYEGGDPIYLNSRDGERFNAQIHSITPTREIWIKKLTEGTRLKIYVSHLQRGKYSIERRKK